MRKLVLGLAVIASVFVNQKTFSQTYDQTLGQELNAISTSVPFLMTPTSPRAGAMGDVGVATTPDGYSQHWNSSKLAFIKQSMGASISYTPWLKKLVDDINLAYVSGYYRLDENQTIGAGLRYFSMGSITFTNDIGNEIGDYSPHEFAIDGSYNRKLSNNFSLGIAGRFILSNLTGGQGVGSETTEAGTSVAIDINGYYTRPMVVSGYKGSWAAGFNVSNIGAKLGYTEDEKNFIPTNLRLGGAATIDIDDYNSISVAFDINKLLVPTPPHYYSDGDTLPDGTISDGLASPDNIKFGKDNNVGIIQGMVQSFNDAPGGFEEELHELTYSVGVEYWYAKQFAARAGYFYEHATKGNRKYFTAGVGLKMNVFGLDFSYLIPAGNFNNSPLSNTWRFSLLFDMDAFSNQ